ncbi:hypothetical protein IMX07_10775 [bacterium]|jgi:hypothetical protein|nr:hypothetical protein [bacterium]
MNAKYHRTRVVAAWLAGFGMGIAVGGCLVARAGDTLVAPTVGLCDAMGQSAVEIVHARDAGIPASRLIARVAALPGVPENLRNFNYSLIGTLYASTATADEARANVVSACLKASAR